MLKCKLLLKYLTMLYKENKFVLHALKCDDAILLAIRALGTPNSYSRGSIEHASLLMELYLRHVARVPGGGGRRGIIQRVLDHSGEKDLDLSALSFDPISYRAF